MNLAEPGPARCAPRWWPLLVLFGAQAVYLTVVFEFASSHTAKPELLPIDGINLPGAETSIGVRIVDPGRRSLKPEVKSHKVYIVEEAPEGAAAPASPQETPVGDDGRALITLKSPEKPGLGRFHAHAEDSLGALLSSGEASLRLASVPADMPILFVAIPQAIESPSDCEQLRALASPRRIVYLALRKLDNPARLREWLQASNLPDGPILTPRSGMGGSSLEALLANLQLSRWRVRPCAIIPVEFETLPFARNGIRTIRLGASLTAKAAEVMVSGAPDWNEARKIVEASR